MTADVEALTGDRPCAGCERVPGPRSPVAWSPAFGMHLCPDCRVQRTDAELHATEKANNLARFAAAMAAKGT